MVLIGAVGGAVPYRAEGTKADEINEIMVERGEKPFDNIDSSYNYILLYDKNKDEYHIFGAKESEFPVYGFVAFKSNGEFTIGFATSGWLAWEGDGMYASFLKCYNFNHDEKITYSSVGGGDWLTFKSEQINNSTLEIVYCDIDLLYCTRLCANGETGIYYKGTPDPPQYDNEVGYLTGLSHQIAYARGKYFNYNEDSRTDRWSFDDVTTTNNDLTQGRYSIKHYVRPVLVTGYDDEDVVEKYEKYYDGEYDATLGYVQYLDKDLDERLETQGYDGPSWIDKYILGRFVLRWHYFEVVDNATGNSGGFVRLRPKDVDDLNGGTEYWVDYVDENDNIIDGTDGDVAYRGEGSYIESEDETIEDAFDDAEEDVQEQEEHTNIANLDGLEVFSSVMESFASSTADFSAVILNFFNCLPAWVLTVFGLSVALTFLMFIIKNLR